MSMKSQPKHHRTEDCRAFTTKDLVTLVALVGKASSSLRCLSRANLLFIMNPWRIRIKQTRPRSNTAPRPSLPRLPSYLTINHWWRLQTWSYQNSTIKKIPLLKQFSIIVTSWPSTSPVLNLSSPRSSCHLGFMLSSSISSSWHPSQRCKRPKIRWFTWSTCQWQLLRSRGIN